MAGNIADFNLTGSIPGVTDYQSFGVENMKAGDFTTAGAGQAGNLANVGGGALALGVGAYDLFKGNPDSAPQQALQGDAAKLGAESSALLTQGQGLQSYLEQGTLPPAQAAQLEMAQNAAKARIVQGAATRGQNTDPRGNSGLTQDINSLGLQTEVERGALEKQLFDAGNSLISQGNTALGMEIGIQEKLAAIDAQQQADTTNAIMGFAKSLGSMDWGKIGSSLSSIGSSIGSAAAAGDVGALAADAAMVAAV